MTAERLPLIQIDRLTKRFGIQWALRGLTLSLHEGEVVALLGPNGAGKTTLLKLLSTLSRPSSGQVLVNGQPLTGAWAEVRRHIGLVTHHSLLYADLTAEENLRFFAQLYGLADGGPRAEQLMEWVDLLPRYRDPVRTYSRGMVQRLTIARALLHDPQILLLDEPFSGLDEAAAERLQALLMRIHAEEPRRLTIISSHNLPRSLALAGRVVILKRGQLLVDEARAARDADAWRQLYLDQMA